MTRRRAWVRVIVAVTAVCLGSGAALSAQAPVVPVSPDPHAGHGPPPAPPPQDNPSSGLPPFIPAPTDEDRRAAFPEVGGHTLHDRAIHAFLLFDQLEWRGGADRGLNLDATGWIGGDRNRLWFRAEGSRAQGRVDDTQAHVLYGRQIARWWDVVAGVRQDMRPGPAQTWAAVGIQGIAPYWFDVEATAYLGADGRTHARFEMTYELLFTNRLVLQPLLDVELYGRADPERRVGAGLSTTDLGLRLRYEFRREFAPYLGLVWRRAYGGTADVAIAEGDPRATTQFVTGARLWF